MSRFNELIKQLESLEEQERRLIMKQEMLYSKVNSLIHKQLNR